MDSMFQQLQYADLCVVGVIYMGQAVRFGIHPRLWVWKGAGMHP